MTEEIAEIVDKEFTIGHGQGVDATLLSNNYFVSTTKLIPRTKFLDGLMELLVEKWDISRAELAEMGMLGLAAPKGEYETMVFVWDPETETRSSQEVAVARYDTLEEAQAGHKEMVERWRRMTCH